MKKKCQAVQISKKDVEHLEVNKRLICQVNVTGILKDKDSCGKKALALKKS